VNFRDLHCQKFFLGKAVLFHRSFIRRQEIQGLHVISQERRRAQVEKRPVPFFGRFHILGDLLVFGNVFVGNHGASKIWSRKGCYATSKPSCLRRTVAGLNSSIHIHNNDGKGKAAKNGVAKARLFSQHLVCSMPLGGITDRGQCPFSHAPRLCNTLLRASEMMAPTSSPRASPIRSKVSSVGFHGVVSKLLISDWLRPVFSARRFPEIRCRFRSSMRSFTTSAPISSCKLSFTTLGF